MKIKKLNLSILFSIILAFCLSLISPSSLLAQAIPVDSYSEASDSVYPVRLDLKLVDMKTKIIGSAIIPDVKDEDINSPFKNLSNINSSTIVESTFIARARAFGGDIYLPAYREDVVSQAIVTLPKEGSNALVQSQPTIEILGNLPQVKGKYLLKEYEETTIRIKIAYKILPKSMPSKLIFATQLNTVLWYPVAYENGQNDPGLDPSTGERLVYIPLINATYIPQQVTRVNWRTEPVILLKAGSINAANTISAVQRVLKFFQGN